MVHERSDNKNCINNSNSYFFRLIDAEQPTKLSSSFGWKQYHDLPAIYAWLDELLKKYPNILTNYDFGRSYENRTMRAIKLSHNEVI